RLALLDRIDVELGHDDRDAVARIEVADGGAGVGAGRRLTELEARMTPDDLGRERAGEAGGAGYEDAGGGLAAQRLLPVSHGAPPRSPQVTRRSHYARA